MAPLSPLSTPMETIESLKAARVRAATIRFVEEGNLFCLNVNFNVFRNRPRKI